MLLHPLNDDAEQAERPKASNPFQRKIDEARALLDLMELIGPAVARIQDLVQRNADFFGALPGDSTMERAAQKLEELVGKSR